MSAERVPVLRKELLIGCGARRERIIGVEGRKDFQDLVTLDVNPAHHPDVVHDLEVLPLPFSDNEFDEIHAYEVLEHIGRQGDWRGFFAQFSEFWRILKPGGYLCATCPSYRSLWAWGDPSHTRVITKGTLVFLDQRAYHEQVGKTAMSDFRHVYQADFDVQSPPGGDAWIYEDDQTCSFVIRARKPVWLPPRA